ncbi:MAG: prepilin peptidase [Candidatus Daviesbacteria bacterium]|nr:MAG: prepilin peptidase [Candidatus Daviesbacteria bacterium]
MLALLGFIVGAVLGSFIKTLTDRILRQDSLGGRSRCPHCSHPLAALDLIPLLSFIFLQGRCRHCHKNIGLEYLLVEVVMGVLIAYLFIQYVPQTMDLSTAGGGWISSFQLLFKIFLISVLVALALADLKKMLIPDRIVLPAILISTVYLLILAGSIDIQLLIPNFLSAFVIWLFFMAIILVTGGKGMGGGDAKLGVLIGLSVGFPLSLLSIMLSFFLGAGVALILVALRKRRFGQTLPFGPFMVSSTIISLFWGYSIIDWYLKLSF